MAIHDADQSDFAAKVIERSTEIPVVVDFWAEWCGPCRQLSPALESEAAKRGDDVDLVKVDVDGNQALASEFKVQGIPAVKAFRDRKVVGEFTGAIPPAQVARFFDSIVPSKADRLASAGDEESLRAAIALDPGHRDAAIGLARIEIANGRLDAGAALLEQFAGDFEAEGLRARCLLAGGADGSNGPIAAALGAWDEGERETALAGLLDAVSWADEDRRELLRKAMVGIFTELGPEHELSREYRRRLAAAL